MSLQKTISGLLLTFCATAAWAGPLHDAAEVGDLAKARQLVESHSADISEIDQRGIWPLLAAVSDGNTKMVELLLELKADPNQLDQYHYSALHEAASLGFHKVIKILALAHADLNAHDINDITPLGYAMRSQSMDAVEVLQKLGATP